MLGQTNKLRWWHALWQSFYARTIYQVVALQWQGWGAAYLLVVSALAIMPATWDLNDRYQNFISQELPHYLADFPDITIENGVAQTPEKHPYILNRKNSNTPFIVIDTSGQYTNPDQTTAPILITANQILLKQPQNGVSSLEFADFTDMTLDSSFIAAFMDSMGTFIVPLTFIMLLGYFWSKRIFQSLIYGLIGSWMGKRKGLQLPFRTYVRISAVTLTPAIAFDLFAGMLLGGLPIEIIGILFFLLEMIYLRFAIQSISQLPRDQNNTQDGFLSA